MRIKTSKGNEYEAVFAYAPTFDGALMIHLVDSRKLSAIAAEFEGIRWVDAEDITQVRYSGYNDLKLVSRMPDGNVQIKLYKG